MDKCPLCKSVLGPEKEKSPEITYELISEVAKRLFPREWLVLKRIYCEQQHVSFIAKEIHVLQASVLDIENEALTKMVKLMRILGRPTNRQEIKGVLVALREKILSEPVAHKKLMLE